MIGSSSGTGQPDVGNTSRQCPGWLLMRLLLMTPQISSSQISISYLKVLRYCTSALDLFFFLNKYICQNDYYNLQGELLNKSQKYKKNNYWLEVKSLLCVLSCWLSVHVLDQESQNFYDWCPWRHVPELLLDLMSTSSNKLNLNTGTHGRHRESPRTLMLIPVHHEYTPT